MLIAIISTHDTIRPEVIQAVKNYRTAGVVVRMVAGDFFARVIAITTRKCSTPRTASRSFPLDKLRHVSFLMECCEVVAVTINSSNNSSALKQADAGLFIGCCGTELANTASDIVIINDNCNSIVSALKWDCHVYDNTHGFIQFQLTVNFSAIIVAFIDAIYLHSSLLKTIQIIWINHFMNSFGVGSLIISFLLRHIRLKDHTHIICQQLP